MPVDFGATFVTGIHVSSVDTLRELYAPYYRRVNDWIHRHTTWKTFQHSWGAVEKFIPTFLESGFDILKGGSAKRHTLCYATLAF